MTFNKLSFVFLFLPMSLIAFYCCPNKMKNGALAAVSVLFYTLSDATHLPLMLGSILFDYLMCFWIVRAKGNLKQRKIPFWLCVSKNLILLLAFGIARELLKIQLPLGLLIYTTTAMGYMIDVYNGDERFEKNIVNFVLFCSFFGKIVVGPVVQYSDMKGQIEAFVPKEILPEKGWKYFLTPWNNPAFSLNKICTGFRTFLNGLAKSVILVSGSAKIHSLIRAIPESDASVLAYWMLIISFTFALYFTLSGYCDMARGLAMLFGMELPVNFSYPFQSRTVGDFFNRFNITVTKFINRYVYFFLGGDSNGVLSTILNTLLTTMLMGLWFGVRLNYIVWGIYFTCFILLEKYYLLKYLEKVPPVVDRIYTFAAVMLSFTIFAGKSLGQTGLYLSSMFGFRGLPFLNSQITYILTSNYLIILLCFLCATSLIPVAAQAIRQHYHLLADIIFSICTIGLFGVTIAFML